MARKSPKSAASSATSPRMLVCPSAASETRAPRNDRPSGRPSTALTRTSNWCELDIAVPFCEPTSVRPRRSGVRRTAYWVGLGATPAAKAAGMRDPSRRAFLSIVLTGLGRCDPGRRSGSTKLRCGKPL
jgi:hypothetical protein